MKAAMKTPDGARRARQRGLSIVELTLAMVLSLGLASNLVLAVQQQVAFLKILPSILFFSFYFLVSCLWETNYFYSFQL